VRRTLLLLTALGFARAGPHVMSAPLAMRRRDGEKKRVLMLISDTGGGHRASAAALAAMMRKLRPQEVDVKIVDIWTEYGAWPDNQMAKSYNFLCKHQYLWRFMYHTSPVYEHPWALITRLTCGAGFKRCIGEYDPDLVISLHPLCQHLPLHLTRRFHSGVPFATVCTDLASAHGSWFVKGLDACFVASDEVRRIAERRGVDRSIIRQHGLPVREDFWQPRKAKVSPEQVSKLGLERDKRTVLVVGGGDGVGGLDTIVEATADQLGKDQPGKAQVVALCGKNAKARQRLEAKRAAGSWPQVDVQVRGFTNQMSSYMDAADCLVTKAGPGTIAEAAIKGLPTMLSSFLPGQEFGNVGYVRDHGFGTFAKRPREIARMVSNWMLDDAKLAGMSSSARQSATPQATEFVTRDLLELMDGGPRESLQNGRR